MQFKVGDAVVHLVCGVGQVVRLDKKQFAEAEQLYYEVSTEKTTVWVPVAPQQDAARLRRLTSKPDLAKYRALLKSRPVALTKDHARRRLELAERMKQGSFQSLCEIVRDLTAHSWHKPLSGTDSASLRKVLDSLCREWAASNGVSVSEASREVEALLLEGKQTYL